jgi:alcohol dehydrogenase class IV
MGRGTAGTTHETTEGGDYRRPAQRVFWGTEALLHLPGELARVQSTRPLIVCGASVAAHPSLLPRVIDALQGPIAGVFDTARAHAPLDSVEQASAMLDDLGADSLVAVGGGSALVTARAACIRHGEQRTIAELATHLTNSGEVVSPRLTAPKLAIIAVPTTPTTAVCKAGAAVTVPGEPGRLAMYDPKTRSRSILLDPEFLDSSPAELVRAALLNAFVMAVEGLATDRSHVFSDAMLLHAVRRLADLLPDLAAPSIATHDRVESALVSILVGDGTDTTGGGLTAALSHTIGHHYAAHNGTIDAILLPHVLEASPPPPATRAMIAQALECSTTEIARRLRHVFDSAGTPRALRAVGVRYADADALAAEATNDFSYRRIPHPPATAAVADIIRAAW